MELGSGPGNVRRTILLLVVVFILFSAVTVVLTWPLAVHPTRYYFSPEVPLDGEATIADIWYKGSGEKKLDSRDYIKFYGYPCGVYTKAHTEPAFLYTAPVRVLNKMFGAQAAYNILLFLSFPFAGLLMFALIYYLTGGIAASFLAGFLFAFSPWHTARAFDHLGLTPIYCLPLFALALLAFFRRQDVPSAVGIILAWAVALYTDVQFAFFCGLIGVAWVVAWLVYNWRWKPRETSGARPDGIVERHLALTMVLILAVIAATILPVIPGLLKKDPNVYAGYETRTEVEAQKNSARLWNYAFPPPFSLVGRTALKNFYSGQLEHSQSSEFTLYPSLTALVLAIIGFVLVYRRRRRKPGRENGSPEAEEPHEGGGPIELKMVAMFCAIAAVAAFLLSLPPHINIGSVSIPTPSILQRFIASPFRFYSRWGLVVTFAIVLMAGVGFELLRKRYSWSSRKTVVIMVALLVVFSLEVSIVPPWRSKDIATPPQTVQALSKTPASEPVVFYPLVSSTEYPTSHYKYFQMFEKHPMLNGVTVATEQDLYRMALKDIYSPNTASMLKALGIDKAVVLDSYFSRPDFGNYPRGLAFDPASMPDGYKLVEKAPDGYIYDVVAAPAQVFPLYYSNFLPPVILQGGRSWSVMLKNNAELLLVDKGKDPYHRLVMRVNNPGAAGVLKLKLNGKDAGEATVPQGVSTIQTDWMHLRKGNNVLELSWSGKPSRIRGAPFRSETDFDGYLLMSDPTVENSATPGAP